jgi:hypothetical protein
MSKRHWRFIKWHGKPFKGKGSISMVDSKEFLQIAKKIDALFVQNKDEPEFLKKAEELNLTQEELYLLLLLNSAQKEEV